MTVTGAEATGAFECVMCMNSKVEQLGGLSPTNRFRRVRNNYPTVTTWFFIGGINQFQTSHAVSFSHYGFPSFHSLVGTQVSRKLQPLTSVFLSAYCRVTDSKLDEL